MSNYNMTHTGAQLDAAIQRVLDGYILPSGNSPTITTNGTHNVKNYENAVVNVPQGLIDYTVESGTSFSAPKTFGAKTYLSNGATVSIPSGYIQPSGNLNITTNGTHNVRNYVNAVVDVPVAYKHCQVTPAFSFSNNTTKQTAVYDFGFKVTAVVVIPVDGTAISLSSSTYPLFFAVNGFGYSVGRYGNKTIGISKMGGGVIHRTEGKETEFYWETGNSIHFSSGRQYVVIAFG